MTARALKVAAVSLTIIALLASDVWARGGGGGYSRNGGTGLFAMIVIFIGALFYPLVLVLGKVSVDRAKERITSLLNRP